MACTKSLFQDLKISEQVADAARIDEGLRNDLKQAKTILTAVTKDKDVLWKAKKEFKDAETRVQAEWRKEGMARRSLVEEVDDLSKQVKELGL